MRVRPLDHAYRDLYVANDVGGHPNLPDSALLSRPGFFHGRIESIKGEFQRVNGLSSTEIATTRGRRDA
jgi:hypothetical protein